MYNVANISYITDNCPTNVYLPLRIYAVLSYLFLFHSAGHKSDSIIV